MARFNEIQVGRINRYFQKLLSMKGEVPAPTLAGDVQAILPLEPLGVEARYLIGWDRFGHFANQPATVAAPSRYVFRNAAGSNVVAVVEKLLVMESLADPIPGVTISNGITANAANVLGSPRRIDSRGRPNATLIPSRDSAATAGTAFGEFTLLAQTPLDLIANEDQQIVILPGDGIEIISGVLNVALTVWAIHRERFLEDSERA